MMKKTAWVFLMALVFAVLFSASKAFGQLSQMTYSAGVKSFKNYVKNPDCAKNVLNITASGGSFAKGTTTPLNADTGSECTIDASSSGQTYTWALSTLGQNLKGTNCEARFVFEGDASLYKAYVKNGSSKVTTDLQLTYPTYSQAVSINAPCGDLSASNTIVIESTSASAAAISVAQVYFGEATNLSNVSQAQDLGTVTYVGAAGGTWTTVSTSFGNFTAATGNAGTATGFVTAPGTKIPAVVLSSIQIGTYCFTASGEFSYGVGAGQAARLRFNDGTNSSNVGVMEVPIVSGTIGIPSFEGCITYSSQLGSTTVNLQGVSSSAGSTLSIFNTTAGFADFTIRVIYFPSGQSQVVNVNAGPFFTDWASYTPTGGWSGGGSTYTGMWRRVGDSMQLYAKATVTSGPTGNLYFALPSTACGGAQCTIDTAKIPGTVAEGFGLGSAHALSGGNWVQSQCAYRGTTSIEPLGLGGSSASNHTLNYHTSTSPFTTSSGDYVDVFCQFPIVGWTSPSAPVPILVGSVTSNTSGMERVERVSVTSSCSASPCTIASQSGSWLTNITRTGAGAYVLNFSAGIFSAAPTCNGNSGNAGAGARLAPFFSSGSSGSIVVSTYNTVPTQSDDNFYIQCQGPR